jgi:hypothetical protein
MGWITHVERLGKNTYKVLLRIPEGRGQLGRPRLRWKGSIKMDLKEIACDVVGWINLAQDRNHLRELVIKEMILRVP